MKENHQITVGSMFAGIGGICLGFKAVGCKIIWANEMDAAACKTYRHNFGADYLVEGDIQGIQKDDIPHVDILTAGFPCQPFSLAGPHRGFGDKRGNLFFSIIEVAEKIQPEIIFLENVANLIDHDDGRTFITMFNALSALNYYIRYRNLPANEYGNTPQTRNRTYIIAFKDARKCQNFKFPQPIELTKDIFDIVDIHTKQDQIYYYEEADAFYPYLIGKVVRKDSIYRVHDSGIHLAKNRTCPTLTASMGTRKNMVPLIIDDYGYRKLTLRECLDFQGFPTDFCFPKTVTVMDAYKQIGNSVCVPVITRVAEQIVKLL